MDLKLHLTNPLEQKKCSQKYRVEDALGKYCRWTSSYWPLVGGWEHSSFCLFFKSILSKWSLLFIPVSDNVVFLYIVLPFPPRVVFSFYVWWCCLPPQWNQILLSYNGFQRETWIIIKGSKLKGASCTTRFVFLQNNFNLKHFFFLCDAFPV